MFVYLRRTDEEELLVMGNFSGREAVYPLPEGWGDASVLLANYPDAAGSTFCPWERFWYQPTRVSLSWVPV